MTKNNKVYFISFVIVLVLALLNVHVFMGNEQSVYFWDSKNFWMQWMRYADLLFQSPLDWGVSVYTTVTKDDYNALSTALLFPFKFLPIDSRSAYIYAITITYLIPVILLATFILLKIFESKSPFYVITTAILVVLYTPFWKPTLRGLPDVVGLIPVLCVIYFTIKNDLSNRVLLFKSVFLGILLWMPFAFRRWYIFTVITLYITLPFFVAFYHDIKFKFELSKAKNILINFFISGIITVALALLIQKELITRIISTDYSTMYSAYQYGFSKSLMVIFGDIGLFMMPFFIFGIISAISNIKTKQSVFVLFSAFSFVISVLLFTGTQTPGIHHVLPFSLWFLFVSIFGLNYISSLFKSKDTEHSLLTIIMVGMTLISVSTFNKPFPSYKNDFHIFPDGLYPYKVSNFDEYKRLSDRLVALTNSGDKISVFSSNYILNDDMLLTISNFKLTPRVFRVSQVDLRDKLRVEAFSTKYVVVTDPIQLHLNKDGQRVISYPATLLLNKKGIGSAYKKLDEKYQLSKGVSAYIYEKQRPFTESESQDFIKNIVNMYPQWNELYNNTKTLKLLSE
ncbi:TPA: hypothetical protein OTQ61_003178 [Citrobacter koseri]|nr:hypothetical protein [Citrobacter koseri]